MILKKDKSAFQFEPCFLSLHHYSLVLTNTPADIPLINDEVGAVRDMIQSHLLQVVSLVAMEAPTSLEAHHIRPASCCKRACGCLRWLP